MSEKVEAAAVVVIGAVLLCLGGVLVVAMAAVQFALAVLQLMVTPGGAAIVIALIGLYVWMNGGFA